MPATKGSAWVSGSDLHLVGEDGLHWYYTGTSSGGQPAGAVKGMVWVDTHCWYIDETGNQRYIPNTTMSTVQGEIGSLWVNNKFLYWLDQLKTVRYGHSDVAAYSDYGDTHSHGDVFHDDTPHTDSYGTYTNWAHSDVAHGDSSTSHGDWAAYCDVTGWAGSHGDYPASHSDRAHNDNPHQDMPAPYYNVAHSDVAHSDYPSYSDHGDSRPHSDFPLQGATLP